MKLVQDQMRRQTPKTHVHFELASFAEPKLMMYLVDNILPFADSLGMNEQVRALSSISEILLKLKLLTFFLFLSKFFRNWKT